MDYTKKNLSFKIKKAIRYTRLYGISRTLQKIRSQYHMNKAYETLPAFKERSDKRHVAIIGCGNFAFSTIAYYLKKNYGSVIKACCDTNINRAASLFEAYDLDYYTDNVDRIFNDPKIDLVYVASNHASHAEYAIEAVKRGKHVHIEKPHVVSEDQLNRLLKAMKLSESKVSLGFNRPYSPIGQKIKKSLDAEEGSSMLNWFIAGHAIDPDHWYFHEKEGGRILGNLCHWTDFLFQMIPENKRYPVTITPTRDVKSDCDIAVSYLFGDGSVSVITFSAKGHTFEGVRERFSGHKGNTLISMDDFGSLTIERVDTKEKIKPSYRDHGHEGSIMFSYRMTQGKNKGREPQYIYDTALLFLKTKEALDKNQKVVLPVTCPH